MQDFPLGVARVGYLGRLVKLGVAVVSGEENKMSWIQEEVSWHGTNQSQADHTTSSLEESRYSGF